MYWKNVEEIILGQWSNSDHPDDTVADSMLPLPNLKTYFWSHPMIREKVARKTKKLTRSKRKRIDITSIKKDMIPEFMVMNILHLFLCLHRLQHMRVYLHRVWVHTSLRFVHSYLKKQFSNVPT